ncbi:MAG: O-methyltransferase [Lachnospiraceae bacterium]|nr:O-methyltransferase [Lachnospiraceae bacterium]
MIVNERFAVFINSLGGENTPILEEIEREARERHVPVIRREMQSLLKVLLAVSRPEHILEVGTAVGFSALFMAEYDPVPSRITTIENHEKRIPAARENFVRAGRDGQITLLEGDAADILPSLSGCYDFVFMDAAKGQYIHFLPEVMRLLAPGGMLVSDNVLQDGDIIESKYAVTRRNRTIHRRMREYLYELTHHPLLTTAVLPVGDGAAVSVRSSG